MSRKRQQPSHNDDDDPDYQLALRLSAEMNDTPAPGPMNKTSPQQGYDDDADFALALQLQFESENNSVPRNDHAFASSGEYASKAASVATSIWPSSSSNKAGKNTTSYNEQTAAAKNFSSVTDFVQYVRAARCRKCNDVYFRSGLDVSKVHEQWKHSRGESSNRKSLGIY